MSRIIIGLLALALGAALAACGGESADAPTEWRTGQQARVCGMLWGAYHYAYDQRATLLFWLGGPDYADNGEYRQVVNEVGDALDNLKDALWDATEICDDVQIETMLDFHEGYSRDKRAVVEGGRCMRYDGQWANIDWLERRYSSRESCRLDSLR